MSAFDSILLTIEEFLLRRLCKERVAADIIFRCTQISTLKDDKVYVHMCTYMCACVCIFIVSMFYIYSNEDTTIGARYVI